MKLIVCPHCQSDKIGPGRRAVLMGRWLGTSNHPIIYRCSNCTNSFKLTAVGFNGLPEAPAGNSTQRAVD